MNQYETVFILTPVLSDVQMKEAVEKFKAILTQEGAEIINEENWGLKKLAYPIQKKSTGFYQLIEFKAEPSVIEKLEVNYRRDERVIRFLTFLSPCPERTHETVVFERLSLQAMSLSDAPTICPYKQCSTKIKFFRHSANNPAVK